MSFERTGILLSPKAVLHKPSEQGFIPMSETPLDFDIETPFAVVYDGAKDRILYRKGGDRVIYPASTTKLLTILASLKVLNPGEIVHPGDELSLLDEDSSVAGVDEGHALTVEMLVEAMLLPSGNDAAYVLAAAAGERISEGLVSGADAVPVFLAFMEEYGRSIGLVGTHFIVPDGLAFEEHYTTLEDMILIGKAAMKCPLIRRYAATARDDVTYASGHTNTWTNTNPLLHPDSPWYRPAVTGLKTGYLRHNSCILLSVDAKDSYYLVGLFGAEDSDMRCADAVKIVDKLTGGEVTL
jgi:D-alanyl-D-alanine carboxypeptidase (penicillin-binding protein 5/6)